MDWQELINGAYEFWKNNDVDYGQVLKYAHSMFGDLGEFAILFKNYNYQVENGGHLQYFDNGYCQESGGIFAKKDFDIPLHHRMIELFEKLGFHKTEVGKPVYEIMKAFKVEYEQGHYEEVEGDCSECGGYGLIDDEDGEEENCPYCDGEGYETYDEWVDEEIIIDEKLDYKYYAVNDDFFDYFDEFVKENTK